MNFVCRSLLRSALGCCAMFSTGLRYPRAFSVAHCSLRSIAAFSPPAFYAGAFSKTGDDFILCKRITCLHQLVVTVIRQKQVLKYQYWSCVQNEREKINILFFFFAHFVCLFVALETGKIVSDQDSYKVGKGFGPQRFEKHLSKPARLF